MAHYPSPVIAAALITIMIGLVSAASPPPPQMDNIVDALIGAGDFTNWADILSAADPSDFSFSATFFVPADSAASAAAADPRNSILNPFIFAYHIVPQRLSFSDLILFKNHSRLPTLLPNKSILITSNSSDNFMLDATRLTRPDLYSSASVAVHAVASVLDYTLYGDPSSLLPRKPSPEDPLSVDPPVIAIYDDLPAADGAPPRHSVAVFVIACAVLFAF